MGALSPRRQFQSLRNLVRGEGYRTNNQLRGERKVKQRTSFVSQFTNAQLPDEEELERIAGRRAARRKGSRASTVLTDRETLG